MKSTTSALDLAYLFRPHRYSIGMLDRPPSNADAGLIEVERAGGGRYSTYSADGVFIRTGLLRI